jgi:uncharacterized protein
VQTLGDLEPGMILEGVVTNVAAFGAFVDIGVHQDGLVHVSAMSNTFVADPRDVAKSGDVVRVKVLSVDIPRNRISLSMRLKDDGEAGAGGGRPPRGDRPASSRTGSADSPRPHSPSKSADNRPGTPGNAGGTAPRGGAPGPGNTRRGNGPAAAGDHRGNGPGTGGDRRGSGPGPGGDRQAAGSGNPNDRRGGANQGGDRRSTPATPANGAMADALRRAGLVNDKGNTQGKQDRRSDRP